MESGPKGVPSGFARISRILDFSSSVRGNFGLQVESGMDKKWELEAGIPGLAKVKYTGSGDPAHIQFGYSCSVYFDSLDAAKKFRDMVEKAVADYQGVMAQSHIDTVERIRPGS